MNLLKFAKLSDAQLYQAFIIVNLYLMFFPHAWLKIFLGLDANS